MIFIHDNSKYLEQCFKLTNRLLAYLAVVAVFLRSTSLLD